VSTVRISNFGTRSSEFITLLSTHGFDGHGSILATRKVWQFGMLAVAEHQNKAADLNSFVRGWQGNRLGGVPAW
jgi:hypothetical protein